MFVKQESPDMASQNESLALTLSRAAANSIIGARRFTDKFAKTIAADAKGKKILEIGSGKPKKDGEFFQSYAEIFERSNDFVQSDLNPEFGHRVVDITKSEISEEFDIILCLNVLEHIYDLEAAVRGLHRATTPSGFVAIVVPALYPLHDEPHDYWRLTEHSLRRAFELFDSFELHHSGLRKIPFMYSAIARK